MNKQKKIVISDLESRIQEAMDETDKQLEHINHQVYLAMEPWTFMLMNFAYNPEMQFQNQKLNLLKQKISHVQGNLIRIADFIESLPYIVYDTRIELEKHTLPEILEDTLDAAMAGEELREHHKDEEPLSISGQGRATTDNLEGEEVPS